MRKPQSISILFELNELKGAIEAARTLAYELQDAPSPPALPVGRLATGIGSVLSLVVCRLELLHRGISGELDPEVLAAQHNQVATREPPSIDDFKLRLDRLTQKRRSR